MLSFIENIGLILQRYGAVFAQGLWNTLWLSFVSVFLGTFLGILVALGKLSRHKLLNGVVSTYIEIIRGTPILLQLYFFWLALPNILPSISDTTCILSALVVNASAYIAEVIRAGIQAVDAGQREASLSLGMTERAIMTKVIFPQAIKNILPALGNEVIVMIKQTSLASVFFFGGRRSHRSWPRSPPVPQSKWSRRPASPADSGTEGRWTCRSRRGR